MSNIVRNKGTMIGNFAVAIIRVVWRFYQWIEDIRQEVEEK